MVMWNGENYLLKLANLWANLISPNPPPGLPTCVIADQKIMLEESMRTFDVPFG